MPDSAAPLPDPENSAGEPEQPTKTNTPLGCLRQATTQIPAGAIIPQPTCKAKVCPGNCRPKRSQDAS
ncbi:MAG: hypothetical protein ACRYFZ_17580 [Janthinobacterium lividum]